MRGWVIPGVMTCCARMVFAQAGPPMITDDPGTPGNGKWEINVAVAFEHRSGETALDVPTIDLNYGVGEHIQLNLQGGPAALTRSGHGPIAGLGGTEAAVKWRFLDEDSAGLDVSMYPRILFNITESSVRRGLAEPGTRFQIPFQAAKSFGRFAVDAEFGPLVTTVGRSEWLYGLVGALKFGEKTMVMAELHGTSRTDFSRDTLTVNIGLHHEITEHIILITSLGHELRSPENSLALVGYFGVQLALGGH
ncbi:MAG: hypothetical protein ACJ8M1_15365 [Chthoniobacterales bacterium]